MANEMIFLYQLYTSFYKHGLKSVNVSKDVLKMFLPYLKCMMEEDKISEISSLFMMDEDGVYSNYLEYISLFDPLFAVRDGNMVKILVNEEMCKTFYNADVDYIGEKVAILRKIKEKSQRVYENN